jgi:hypothetical protein
MAARLFGSAEGWHEQGGLPVSNTQADELAGAIEGARARLSKADWENEYRAGYDAWVEDALAQALRTMAGSPIGATECGRASGRL